MTQSIFITAANPYGFAVGSAQVVSDAIAVQALADIALKGGWGQLSSVTQVAPQTPTDLARGALTPNQAAQVVALVSGDGITGTIGAAVHASSIDARILANGATIGATVGKLKTIAGGGASSLTVSGGAMVCNDATSATYVVLQLNDTVQYMRSIVQYPSAAQGTLAMVIPDPAGTFPGMDGAGNANAGVHCIFPCFATGVEVAQVGCGGYGSDAGAITGVNTASLLSVVPFRGYTREMELYLDKRTGRVTVQIDGITVVDYVDTRTLTYVGQYAIFELFGASQIKPKLLYVEASTDAKSILRDDVTRLNDVFLGSATTIPTSWGDAPFTITPSNSREATTLVMVSAWIDQTSGDTSFRLTDGTAYSTQVVMARGAFSGRVTLIDKLMRSPVTGATIKLQAQNPAGGATFGAFSSIGYQQIASAAVMQLV